MFEKEAEEYFEKECLHSYADTEEELKEDVMAAFKSGAEFGYYKGKEDVKYDLMMKLKDEGIVTPLKDSIFYNQRLSSQEQQELCSWIECAMDFGENLDEAVERIEKLEKIILKLRNCENCKYHSFWGDELKCNYGLKEALQEDKLVECHNLDKWEMKE